MKRQSSLRNFRRTGKKISTHIISAAVIISMFFGMIPVKAAWDGYIASADEDVISLINFSNASEVAQTGAELSSDYTKGDALYSVYWRNQTSTKNLYFDVKQKDWTEYERIEMDIYSVAATGTEFMIVIETEEMGDGYCYYNKKMNYDWVGWKKITIPLGDMTRTRSSDWAKVKRVRLTVDGWAMVPSAAAGVYIASMNLVQNGGSSLAMLYDGEKIKQAEEAMSGAVAVYSGRSYFMSASGNTLPIDAEGSTSIYENGVVYVPDTFFKSQFGAQTECDANSWSITMNGTKIDGILEESICIVNGIKKNLTAGVKYINNHLYLPAAEIAKLCNKTAVEDGRLVIIGSDEKINVFERISGVNELTEIVAYMAGHKNTKPDSVTEADFKAAKDNWRYELVGSEAANDMSNELIADKIETISKNGKDAWEKLIKKDGQKELFEGENTTTSKHMSLSYQKVYYMALAYGTAGSELYKNEDLRNDIVYGLEWLYNNRYGMDEFEGKGWRSPNSFDWHDWYVESPEYIVYTMLIIEDYLSDEQKVKYLTPFDRLNPLTADAGSNRFKRARIAMGSALLQSNAKKIIQLQTMLDDSFIYVDNNRNNSVSQLYGDRGEKRGHGFYTDGTYLFHTAHFLNGVYGLGHIASLSRCMNTFRDTAFEVTNPHVDNVCGWVYNAYLPLIYDGGMFRLAFGRAGHNAAAHGIGVDVLGVMLDLVEIVPEYDAEKFKSYIKRQITEDSGTDYYAELTVPQTIELIKLMNDETVLAADNYEINKIYYQGDIAVHQRESFGVGISMSSSRMFNYESINNEGITDWYVGDGMVETRIDDDYIQSDRRYWRYINPYRLPGTTVDTQERQAVSIAQGNAYLSSKDFVGGVSNGTYGAASMWLESYHNEEPYGNDNGSYGGPAPKHDCNLEAKKSYFMFDDEIVCVGSDINASNGFDVLTVVDNKLAYQTKQISEAETGEKYEIAGVVASATPEAENVAANTIDDSYGTKWAAEDGDSITWDIGEVGELGFITLAFQNGSKRTQNFTLETSADGVNWTETFTGDSSGTTELDEAFTLNETEGRFVRFTNHGNSAGSEWVSLTKAEVYSPNPDGSIEAPEVNIVGVNKVIVDGAETEVLGDDVSLKDAKWVHLEKVGGYYFPEGGNLFARYTKNTDSFFELWLNHGVNPQGETYAYVMMPSKSADEVKAYSDNPDIEVLENTPSLQVVKEKNLGITAMVFWEAGEYNGISVNEPMMVMVEEKDGRYNVSVSDPTHKLTSGRIVLPKRFEVQTNDAKMNIKTTSVTTIDIDFAGSDGRTMTAEMNGL